MLLALTRGVIYNISLHCNKHTSSVSLSNYSLLVIFRSKQRRGDICVCSTTKPSNYSQEIPAALHRKAKRLSQHNTEGSAKGAGQNYRHDLLELQSSIENHPGLTGEQVKNEAPPLGYKSSTVPLWDSRGPIKKKPNDKYLEPRHLQTSSDVTSERSVSKKSNVDAPEDKVRWESLLQIPSEQVKNQSERKKVLAKEENALLERYTSMESDQGLTEEKAHGEALQLGYQGQSVPLLHSGGPKTEYPNTHTRLIEEEAQREAQHLGYKGPDVPMLSYEGPTKEHPNTSIETHPGLIREQAHGEAPHLGYKSQEAPLSFPGGSTKEQPYTCIKTPPRLPQEQAQSEAPHLGYKRRDILLSDFDSGGLIKDERKILPTGKLTPSPLPSSSNISSESYVSDTTASEDKVRWLSGQSPVRSLDCLPTFTNQRPADVPTATGKHSAPKPSYDRNNCSHEQRYNSFILLLSLSSSLVNECLFF